MTRNSKACNCEKCVALCRFTPGWFTPEQAQLAMAAGHAPSMMLEYWLADKMENNIYILSPAVCGKEGKRAPNTDELYGHLSPFDVLLGGGADTPKGTCTFFSNGLCKLHKTAYKPKQCVECFGCKKDLGPDNKAMSVLWDTDAGRAVVKQWMAAVNLPASVFKECT